MRLLRILDAAAVLCGLAVLSSFVYWWWRPEEIFLVLLGVLALRLLVAPVPVRYFPEASSASFLASCAYGLKILWVVTRYLLDRFGLKRSRRLQTLRGRYSRLGPGAGTSPGS